MTDEASQLHLALSLFAFTLTLMLTMGFAGMVRYG